MGRKFLIFFLCLLLFLSITPENTQALSFRELPQKTISAIGDFFSSVFTIFARKAEPESLVAAVNQAEVSGGDTSLPFFTEDGVQKSEAATTTIINNYITQPVIERVVTQGSGLSAVEGGISRAELDAALADLKSNFNKILYGSVYPSTPTTYNEGGISGAVALLGKVGSLSDVTINNATVNGIQGLTNADIPSNLDLSISNLSAAAAGSLTGNIVTKDAATSSSVQWGDSQKFITTGSDGFVRFAYFDGTVSPKALYFVQCLDEDCITKNKSEVATTSASSFDGVTVAMGLDGYARITYITYASPNPLHYIRCTNDACSTNVDTLIDLANSAGFSTFYSVGMAIGTDGYARIAYENYSGSSAGVRLAVCNDDDCTAPTLTTVTTPGRYGEVVAMALASDDTARIVYPVFFGTNPNEIRYVVCANESCSSNTETVVDVSGASGSYNYYYVAIDLDSNDLARLAYGDGGGEGFKFVQCTNSTCSEKNESVVDTENNGYLQTTLELGEDGFARILYQLADYATLKYVQCTNADCSTKNSTTLPTLGGAYPSSMTLGSDGYARIIHSSAYPRKIIRFMRLTNDSGTVQLSGSSLGASGNTLGSIFGTRLEGKELRLQGESRNIFRVSNSDDATLFNIDASENIFTIGSSTATTTVNVTGKIVTSHNGVNKWCSSRYAGSASSFMPTYTHILGKTPIQTALLEEPQYYHWGPDVWGDVHQYVARYTTYVYVATSTSVVGTGYTDDGGSIYINGNFVAGRASNGSINYTLNFTRGWNRVDLLHQENGGNHYMGLYNVKLSTHPEILAMDCMADVESTINSGNAIFQNELLVGGRFSVGTTSTSSLISLQATTSAAISSLSVYSSTGGPHLVVTQAGNVGLATSSPWRKLSVTGTVGFDGLTGSVGAGSLCLSSNKEVVYNSASDNCLSSTRDTKNTIQDLDIDALAIVSELNPVSFIYNEGDGRIRYGFIAEDTSAVLASLATYSASSTISGIDDRAILSVVVKALKELITLMRSFTDTVANFAERFVSKELVAQNRLCIGAVCITEAELRTLLERNGISSAGETAGSEVEEQQPPSENPEVYEAEPMQEQEEIVEEAGEAEEPADPPVEENEMQESEEIVNEPEQTEVPEEETEEETQEPEESPAETAAEPEEE